MLSPTREASSPPPHLVAFSGGGDSLALLARCCDAGPTVAVVIDHALHGLSAAVAAQAAGMAEALGAAVILRRLKWPDAPPTDHARIRRARYAALAEAARQVGVDRVLLGHTRDDQAETVLIRWAARSGRRGLAGMAGLSPYPLWPEGCGLLIARPLLGEARAGLRDWLRGRGLAWLEDPANADRRFARVRARQALNQDPGFADRLHALATAAARRAARVDAAALALADRTIAFDPWGRAVLDRAAFAAASVGVQARLLEVLLIAVSGRERGVDPERIAALAARIGRGEGAGETLGGAALTARGHQVIISVDPGQALGRGEGAGARADALGRPLAWQGRFLLEPAPGVGVSVAPPASARPPAALAPRIAVDGATQSLDEALACGAIAGWRALAPERLKGLLIRGIAKS